ncbi:MAG: spermidine/putrescine ABC transporter substrate-binding protein [Microbacteriaceae bacterium]|nr:spermidine/putrescine ABC transporter substrate-binding protein [Microbacteriaceae bacterium]
MAEFEAADGQESGEAGTASASAHSAASDSAAASASDHTGFAGILGESGLHPEWHADQAVAQAVASWLRWVAGWQPGRQRVRSGVCRRCTGSPLTVAAGLSPEVPHQVRHALVMRVQRVIDARVDALVAAHLPVLHAELEHSKTWSVFGFDPRAGLDPEYDTAVLDPEPLNAAEPFLFTLEEFAEVSPQDVLPQPPLSQAEKQHLRAEMARADEFAAAAGREACFALAAHKQQVSDVVKRFVDPQISRLLADLSLHLESPQQFFE